MLKQDFILSMRWLRGYVLLIALIGCTPALTLAEDEEEEEGGVVELSGLTIVGAKETPKSLILVPWKDSNVDVTTSFGTLVDSIEIEPVDRDTLKRKVLFDDLVKQDLAKSSAEINSEEEAE